MSNPITSYNQFVEALTSAVDALYPPRRGRKVSDSESGELFTESGNTIKKVRVKFLIQDDGGDWTRDSLVKPEFIWDLKKISGGRIIDGGGNSFHLNLIPSGVKETDEGLYFYGYKKSRLVSESFTPSTFNGKRILFNIWFRAEDDSLKPNLNRLFTIVSDTKTYPNYVILAVDLLSVDGRLSLRLTYNDSVLGMKTSSIGGTFHRDQLNNLQILCTGTKIYFIKNGITVTSSIDVTSLVFNPNSITSARVIVGESFLGEIHYLSLNVADDSNIDSTLVDKFYKFRYPLPRGKEYVDLSDYFKTHGDNLLIEPTTVSKAIESVKGTLFMKTNEIKVKSHG